MQISEPAIENSGLLQGPFLRRHRILSPSGSPYTPADLVCGRDIVIYSRTLRITSLDAFTRSYCREVGIEPGLDIDVPADPFRINKEREIQEANKPLPVEVIRAKALVNVMCGGHELNRKVKQYLEKDGKILRFYCYWDDDSESGFRHFFQFHYFLSDDSFELIEVFPQTPSCAAARSVFLKRQTPSSGHLDPGAVVISPSRDLLTGKSITLSNRSIFLYDCDAFTRNFYLSEFGLKLDPVPVILASPTSVHAVVPPPTGFGSDEDSLASCGTHLVPRLTRLDHSNSKDMGVILRFEAKMTNPKRNDIVRRFTVGFYPEDGTIAVWEVPIRNSGFMGGKFAERGKKPRPNVREVDSKDKYYSIGDMRVGYTIRISGVDLDMTACDEFTSKYFSQKSL